MMVRDILIGIHAAAATAAFGTGLVLVARVVRGREPRLVAVYVAALAIMAVTVVTLVGWDWPTLGTGLRAGFTALIALAVVMLAAGIRAGRIARDRPSGWRRRFVAAAGFTLISLFAGFVIITSLDTGAPGWAVAAITVAAITVGRKAVRRAEGKAAVRQEESTAGGSRSARGGRRAHFEGTVSEISPRS